MKFRILLSLEIKNTLKKIPFMLLGSVALIVVIGATAFSANKYIYEMPVDVNVKIAVVVEDDSRMIPYITSMIQNSEGVNDNATLIMCDRDEVNAYLDGGGVAAAVIIQENAVKDIMNGTNTPIKIIFPKNSGFESAIIKEVADTAASLLTTAQAGIYAGLDFYRDAGKYDDADDMLDGLNARYITMVLFRNSVFKEEILSATGGNSLGQYYVSCGIVMFLLLFSINIAVTYRKYSFNMSSKLEVSGVRIPLQLLIKYICIAIVYVIFTASLSIIGLFFIEFRTLLFIIIAVLLSLPAISAMVLFFYELMKKPATGIMALFLVNIILLFISGCFIPSLMLPESINILAKYTPIHYSISLLNDAFLGNLVGRNVIILIGFSIIFFLFTVLVANRRNRKEMA
ncbi:MAG: ABC transporter permease [Clostridiales bacterium]|nr:ABC transporter permease [Clostridiales bacterium]